MEREVRQNFERGFTLVCLALDSEGGVLNELYPGYGDDRLLGVLWSQIEILGEEGAR